jgi:MipA family protein
MLRIARLAPLALLLIPTAVHAQAGQPTTPPAPPERQVGAPPATVFDETYLTLGLGLAAVPRYEGSDAYRLFPAPLLQGRVEGFDIAARGPGLAVDLVREAPGAAHNFILGPSVRARFDRRDGFGDARIRALGDRPVAVEAGVQLGYEWQNMRMRGDALSIGIDVTQDIAGGHRGLQIAPSIGWRQPLGRATFAIASASATWASDDYMRTYFSIDAAGSAASGLPQFTAGGGIKDVGAGVILAHDLDGNPLNGGWSLFGIARYTRLLGDAADSPVTAIAGDADQAFISAGVAFTF